MKPDTILGVFNFAISNREWVKERVPVMEVLDKLLVTPLGSVMHFAGVVGSIKKASTRKAFYTLIATGKSEAFALTQDKKAPTATIQLTVTPTTLGVDVRVYGPELKARHATIIDDVVAVATAIRTCSAMAGLKFGYVSPIVRSQASFLYPRPRPPRWHDTIAVGAILDAIDLQFHQSEHSDATAGALKLATVDLPKLVHRTEHDGLVLLRWAEDFDDIAALEYGAAAHEAWISKHLPTTINAGYNELGDFAEPMHGMESRPPLTMYQPQSRTGYVAIVIHEDGWPEDHYWTLAKDVATKRVLPDGTTVDRVRIVAPLRDLAIDFAIDARKQGIDAVLYPADDGTWWDPDPPGIWAYPPRKVATSA